MNTSHSSSSEVRKCPQCGTDLPAGIPPELCPQCLLCAGLGGAHGPQGTVRVDVPAPAQDLLTPGQSFGHYQIVRSLGGGGMGMVFEAEDLENGRRVALKVLSHALDSPESRERFFREGRLAASINHPNSVYVFGTEEIAGTPVISMELVSGGTLEERVRTKGRMPWAEAVDAALQIVAGLEAAQRIGILHRDVKPSNCFLDSEGVTKIGDFGLSISTAIRTEPSLTATGAFLGTPAFCAPEQLRGDELNTRSDIYSVGSTLFYLLTGRTPFEGKNMVAMLATVLENPAPSPRKIVPEIPGGLARIVRRCLEKEPGERFRDYHELREALVPYSSAAPVPATLGIRFLAGFIDLMLLNLVIVSLVLAVFGDPLDLLEEMYKLGSTGLLMMVGALLFALSYYTFSEAVLGATLGKSLCRLRVEGAGRNTPGFVRAAVRAIIYVVLPMLPVWLVYGKDIRAYLSGSQTMSVFMGFSYYVVLALLFSTARRRNGFAAIQDLLTKTRVVSRPKLHNRPAMANVPTPAPNLEGKQMIGPYHVLENLSHEWQIGFDLRLLRKVWIRSVPAGTPPVPTALRNLGRPTRLRWLAGRRSEVENWEAYEASSGRPLIAIAGEPQPWQMVRFWLHDLAQEIDCATRDGTLPVLALSRVWITTDGRAKLLDFEPPGVTATTKLHSDKLTFLNTVAAASLAGQENPAQAAAEVRLPLPLYARKFLRAMPLMDAGSVAANLKPLLQRACEVTPRRRAAIVAGCVAITIPVVCSVIFGAAIMRYWSRTYPGVLDLHNVLNACWAVETFQKTPAVPKREQFAIFIAGNYRAVVTNEVTWNGPVALMLIKGKARKLAEQSIRDYPTVSSEQLSKAEAALKPYLPKVNVLEQQMSPGLPLMVAHIALVVYVALPALIAALAFRGGLILLLTGVTFVRRNGTQASRLRVFWRVLIAWIPVVVATILVMHPSAMKMPLRQLLVLAGLLILTGVSIKLPRSLPDRLAGTWPVLR